VKGDAGMAEGFLYFLSKKHTPSKLRFATPFEKRGIEKYLF
jgi:hypothetical protein